MEEFLEVRMAHRMQKAAFLTLAILFVSCTRQEIRRVEPSLAYPGGLGVVLHDQWGWKPGEATLPVHQIEKITIHHGGEDFPPDKDPVEYIRNLQAWSRSEKKWVDIPYHFMIDLKGTIYEARPIHIPGDTNTDYDVKGHALICVMGNYEHQVINESQLSSLVNLTAFLAQHFKVTTDAIKGHKDYTETLCPGKDLYRYLQDGTIVSRVKQQLNQAKEFQQ